MNEETRIDLARAEPLRAESLRAEPLRAESLRAEPLGTGPLGSEPLPGELAAGEEVETPARRRWIVLGIVAVILALLAWTMLRPEPVAAPPAGGPLEQAPTVTVVTPGRTTLQGTITATGTLAARRELPVGAVGEGGQVVRVLADAGAWVRQGQVLAVVDRSVQNQQAAGQAAQIQVAQADAKLAQDNLDRALKLVRRGFISKADVDRLTATRDAAVARVRVARAQLGELRARADRLSIVAPAAGYVLERSVEPGQVVGGSSGVLFRIAQGGQLEMQARVAETDLAKLSVGQSALVTPAGTEAGYTGQIWQLSPTIDPQSRQGTVRIALTFRPGLRPGGFATAEIQSGTVVAPVLPESAILSDAQGTYVYVVGRDNKVERLPVRTGIITEQGIAVVDGLSGSERVVLRAGGFLSPGEKVVAKAGKV